MRKSGIGWLLVGLLVGATVGCGGRKSNHPPLVPVSGTVTMDDKPLSGAIVTFVPSGSTRGDGANGFTDASGKYELVYRGNDKGVPTGEYRVVVTKLLMPDGSDFPIDSEVSPMDSPAKQVLPVRYSDVDQTTLTANVPEAGGTIDFPLKSKP